MRWNKRRFRRYLNLHYISNINKKYRDTVNPENDVFVRLLEG